jgi:hypothetical protein
MKTTYHVTARRDGKWWYLEVPEIGAATQARRLEQAEYMARDLIAAWLRVPADSFDVRVSVDIPRDLVTTLDAARDAKARAQNAQTEASRAMRRAVGELCELDLPVRDIGQLLGISHQRAAALVGEVAPERPRAAGREARTRGR